MWETSTLVLSSGTRPADLVRAPTVRASADAVGATAESTAAVNDLPLLLAGPVLRWAAPDRVKVWLVTSADLGVTGEVVDAGDTTRVLGTGTGTTTRWGPRLFVTMVTITPTTGSFPAGAVLAYDLDFTPPEGHLFDSTGFVVREEIAYGGHPLPTFVLGEAPGAGRLRLAHASCRKPHADGDDAMRRLDTDMQSWAASDAPASDGTWTSPRPRALLLTGDQIYGDDVHPDFIRVLSHLQTRLLGFRERLPRMASLDARAPEAGDASADIGPTHRGAIVVAAGFTVGEGEASNHLLSFGEFVGMYLLAWSPSLWRHSLVRGVAEGGDLWSNHRAVDGATAARRVLANVPAYMMFDDHEVTDDFPMSIGQRDRIAGDVVGRWVIANGIAACWLMQLDGNYDGGHDPGAIIRRRLTAYLAAGRRCGTTPTAEQTAAMIEAADRYAFDVLRDAKGFGYVTPTVPPVIVLDTRTQRELHDEPTGAELLDAAALRWLADRVSESLTSSGGAPCLVVSPAPVIGNSNPELIQELLRYLGGFYFLDSEAWSGNRAGWFAFLRRFAACRDVVFFSGDVHHGYVASGRLRLGGAAPVRLLQLTASPLRNPLPSAVAAEFRSHRLETTTVTEGGDSLELTLHPMGGEWIESSNHYATVEVTWSAAAASVGTTFRSAGGADRSVTHELGGPEIRMVSPL